MKIINFKKAHQENQELEVLDFELSQIYKFEKMSDRQKIKYLKGEDIDEVLDKQFSSLHKVRKKLMNLSDE